MKIWMILSFLSFTSGCTALSQQDADKLRDKYIENTRKLGLEPVYPPNEEFQVGDVFFVSHPSGKPDDIDNRAMIYLGTIQDVRKRANNYLSTRINFGDTSVKSDNLTESQSDFQGGVVSTNNAARTSLPLVSYPAVTGSASSAAAFGGFAFGSSSAFGLGRSETVSIDFGDTRGFGLPLGSIGILTNDFVKQYNGIVCQNEAQALKKARVRAFQNIQRRQKLKMLPSLKNENAMCMTGRDCHVRIITRTLTTRQINYTYTGATVGNLAATQARGELPDSPETTLAVPSTVDLNITIGAEADAANIQALVNALDVIPKSGPPATPTSSLQFVGVQGNAARFTRRLQKPVAIAHEAVFYDFDGGHSSCGLKLDPKSGVFSRD